MRPITAEHRLDTLSRLFVSAAAILLTFRVRQRLDHPLRAGGLGRQPAGHPTIHLPCGQRHARVHQHQGIAAPAGSAARRSPRPLATARPDPRKNGTSMPSSTASSCSLALGQPRRHSRLTPRGSPPRRSNASQPGRHRDPLGQLDASPGRDPRRLLEQTGGAHHQVAIVVGKSGSSVCSERGAWRWCFAPPPR